MTDATKGTSADLNLLFAFLALQMNFIDRDQLLQAMSAWVSDKSKPLSDILMDLGFLTEQRRTMLEPLVQEHLQQNDNDPEKSLVAVQAATMSLAAVREALGQVGDSDIEQSILRTSASPAIQNDDYFQTQQLSGTTENSASQRYRVLRPHAKGGLGQVSVARDAELNREVALKEIQPQYADDQMSRSRFVLEAEITGGLEHPGIVPVYGLGNYQDGRPYYAMRFIRGDDLKSAISRYHKNKKSKIDAGELSLEFRGLLRRFVDVCNAMEYAHSRQVLHRDIKPGNIMLGKYGETMVVDWGMAKVIAADEDEPSLELDHTPIVPSISKDIVATSMGSAVGTPPYMSPEQAAGRLDRLGPLSDIYGLGATLFHLLTGRPPFRDRDIGSVLNRVMAGDFEPPRELDPSVPKPLEAICLKAMATGTEQRYQSAIALGDDLEHWLADEPVTALKESTWQRTARWFRKHRTWTQAAACALVAIALVSTVATVVVNGARKMEQEAKVKAEEAEKEESLAKEEAETQRDYAVNRLRQARENINRWVVGGAEALNQHWLFSDFRVQHLELAIKEFEELAEQETEIPILEIERGRAYKSLANVQRLLGRFDSAEQSYHEGLKLFQKHEKDPEVELEAQLETAQTNIHLGLLFAEKKAGSTDAESFYQAALTALGPVLENQPDLAAFAETYVEAQLNLGELFRDRGELDQAASTLGDAIQRLEDLLKQSPGTASYIIPLGKSQQILGEVLVDQGSPREGLNYFQHAIDACEILIANTLDDESDQDEEHLEAVETIATANVRRAKALGRLGRHADQVEACRLAMESFSQLSQTRRHMRRYNENHVVALHNRATTLYKLGETERAEADYRQALIHFETLERIYELPEYAERKAASIDATARVFSDQDKNADAVTVFRRAQSVFSVLARDFPEIPRYRERMAVTQAHIGKSLHKLGQDAEARAEALKSEGADDEAASDDAGNDEKIKDEQAKAKAFMAEALRELNSAIETFNQLIDEQPDLPQLHAEIAAVYKSLAWLQWDLGDKGASSVACGQAIEHWKIVADDPNLPSLDYLNQLSLFLLSCPVEDLRDAEAGAGYAKRAHEAAQQNAFYCVSLGIAAYRSGNWSEAIEWFDQAAELRDGKNMAREMFFQAMSHWQQAAGPNDVAEKHYQDALGWMQQHRPGNMDLGRIRDQATELREKLAPE